MTNGAVNADIDRKTVYKVLSDMADTASTIANHRFYCYLVANSIFAVAWVGIYKMLYDSSITELHKLDIGAACVLALGISVFGIRFGKLFNDFLKRTKAYERHYIGWAAQMEIESGYHPRPYIWTGLIQKFAEVINSFNGKDLDRSTKCHRQQDLLKIISEYKTTTGNNIEHNTSSGKIVVVSGHILPSKINCENGKYKLIPNPLDDEKIKEYFKNYPRPSGTAYRIFQFVPMAFMWFFFATAVLTVLKVLSLLT